MLELYLFSAIHFYVFMLLEYLKIDVHFVYRGTCHIHTATQVPLKCKFLKSKYKTLLLAFIVCLCMHA